MEISVKQYNGHNIAVVEHATNDKKCVVIFCHGFRSSSLGPNRFFVRAARKLETLGISSIRFDQYGSGNSDGDFMESSFTGWVETIAAIAKDFFSRDYKVALFGQSMGASAAICAASELEHVDALVAWVPDASVDELRLPDSPFMEEGGQRVGRIFWEEAHEASISKKLKEVQAPAYIVQTGKDEFVDAQNRQAIADNALPQHQVVYHEDLSHSSWTYDQAEQIIDSSISFIGDVFSKSNS